MCDRCELNYILNNFMTKFVNKHQFGRIHTSKSASAFCKKFAETMYIHDRCKIFCNFFRYPDRFAQFGNYLQAPKKQSANLQIFNVDRSTVKTHVNPSTDPYILLLFTSTRIVPIVQSQIRALARKFGLKDFR